MEVIIRSIVLFNDVKLFVVVVSVVHSLILTYLLTLKSNGDSLQTISLSKMWRVDLCYPLLIKQEISQVSPAFWPDRGGTFSSDGYTIKIMN